MENKGWIKLYRAIADTEFWLSEPFTRSQAWVDLLLLANHKTGHIRKRGILVAVERGQVGCSEDTLAKRWKWSKGKVRRFLAELISLSRITRSISEKTVLKNTSVSSLIYILNYDKYQANSTEDGTEDGPKTVMEQECKELKNKTYVTFFDDFWRIYPSRNGRKVGKAETFKKFCQLKEVDLPLIVQAARNYSTSEDVKNGIGIRDPKRFLKDNYWRDWIEPSEGESSSGSYIAAVKQRMGLS